MTDVRNDLEGGSNGVVITTDNATGTGNRLFDLVVASGAATAIAFDNAHTRGSMAAKVSSPLVSGRSALGWNATSLGSVSEAWLRFYAYFTANPTGSVYLGMIVHGATADGGTLRINSSGHLFVEDNNGATQATMTSAVSLNQWVRMEFHILLGNPNGTMDAWLYNTADADVGSPTQQITSTVGPTGVLGNTYDMFLAGNPWPSLVAAGPWWIDDLAVSTTAQLGPSSVGPPSVPPVAGAVGVPTSYVSALTPGTPPPGYRFVLRQAAQRASRW